MINILNCVLHFLNSAIMVICSQYLITIWTLTLRLCPGHNAKFITTGIADQH